MLINKQLGKTTKEEKHVAEAFIHEALTLPDRRTRPSKRSKMYTSSPGVTPSDICCSLIHLIIFQTFIILIH